MQPALPPRVGALIGRFYFEETKAFLNVTGVLNSQSFVMNPCAPSLIAVSVHLTLLPPRLLNTVLDPLSALAGGQFLSVRGYA